MIPSLLLVVLCAFCTATSATTLTDHTSAQLATILDRVIDHGFCERQLTLFVSDTSAVRLLGLDQTDAFRFASDYAQQTVKAHLQQPDVAAEVLPHLRAAVRARNETVADRAVLTAMLHGGVMLRKQMQTLSGYRLDNDTNSDIWRKYRDDLNPIPVLEMQALLSRMLPTAVFETRISRDGRPPRTWCRIPNEVEFCIDDPLAVASIGSVHRVRMLGPPRRVVTIPVSDGKPIRVPIPRRWGESALTALNKFTFILKIRNPRLVANFEQEAETMRNVIDQRASMQSMYDISVNGIREELDLAKEAEKMKAGKLVYESFLNGYSVRVPKVHGVTRDPRFADKGGAMLVMEDAGVAAKSISTGDADPYRGLALMQLAASQFIRLLDGSLLTNSDLHPGNVLWNAESGVLWVLDFGNAGIIESRSLQVLRRIASTFYRIFVAEHESLVQEVVGESEEALTSDRASGIFGYLEAFAQPELILGHSDPIAYMATIASHLRAMGNGAVEYPPHFYPHFRSFLYAMQLMRAGLADCEGAVHLSELEGMQLALDGYKKYFQMLMIGIHRDVSPFNLKTVAFYLLNAERKLLFAMLTIRPGERVSTLPPSIPEWQAQKNEEELRELKRWASMHWQYQKKQKAVQTRRKNVLKTVTVGALAGGTAYAWYRNHLATQKAQAGMPEAVLNGTVTNGTVVASTNGTMYP